MEKTVPNLPDWNNLGFQYIKTPYRFEAVYKDGKWSQGSLVEDEYVRLHEGSTSIHYAQQCFEGMKAHKARDGKTYLFRPEMNAKRMMKTANRILLPSVPDEELFIKGVTEVIKANHQWVPPFGFGGSLYIRPLLIGVGENMGLNAAKECLFRVFCVPVGPYFKGGLKTITLMTTDQDRAAPVGIGNFKAGANYSAGLLSTIKAKENQADEALFLDAKEKRYIDEAGSANILVVLNSGELVTPKSPSILESITRLSIMDIAEKKFNIKTEHRAIDLEKEINNFSEVGACGTAACISPVGSIIHKGKKHCFFDEGKSPGPVMTKLYKELTGIQTAEIEERYGWLQEVQL